MPLEYAYSEIPLAQTLEKLVDEGKAPVYVVHFTQADAAQSAQDFTSLNVCTREEKAAIARRWMGFKFSSPYGPEMQKVAAARDRAASRRACCRSIACWWSSSRSTACSR